MSSNHLSHIDILVVSAVFPSRFVAKSEIQKWPVIGWLASMAGTLFVRRGDRKDVPRVVREMRATLDAGVSVTFFPEGWASRGLRLYALCVRHTPLVRHAQPPASMSPG